MPHTDFAQAFQDGLQLVDEDDAEITIHCREIGHLIVPSGKMIACDPLMTSMLEPFTTPIPPGRCPVILSIAEFHENGDQRVACAKVRISEQEPVRWVMATRPGQDLSTLARDHFFGYGVDSGTGCFMDVVAAQAFSNKMREDANYSELIVDELLKTYVNTWSWLDVPLDPATGANLLAFSSGFGDGHYASFFGYDRAGQLACLVSDFAILGS